MAKIITVNGVRPKIGKNCFLAENAVIIGDVEIGDNCSIWFGAVLRGDVNKITLGKNVNVQDGAVIHTTYKVSTAMLHDNVSVGHNATIHGAEIMDGALVGMGSTVLDHAVVEAGAIVAANSLVLSKSVVKANCIYAGVPAKFVKELSQKQIENVIIRTPKDYQMYASWFMDPSTIIEDIQHT